MDHPSRFGAPHPPTLDFVELRRLSLQDHVLMRFEQLEVSSPSEKLCPLADKAFGRRHSPFDIRREHFPAPGLIGQRNVTRTYLKIVDVLKGGSQNCGHAAAER